MKRFASERTHASAGAGFTHCFGTHIATRTRRLGVYMESRIRRRNEVIALFAKAMLFVASSAAVCCFVVLAGNHRSSHRPAAALILFTNNRPALISHSYSLTVNSFSFVQWAGAGVTLCSPARLASLPRQWGLSRLPPLPPSTPPHGPSTQKAMTPQLLGVLLKLLEQGFLILLRVYIQVERMSVSC